MEVRSSKTRPGPQFIFRSNEFGVGWFTGFKELQLIGIVAVVKITHVLAFSKGKPKYGSEMIKIGIKLDYCIEVRKRQYFIIVLSDFEFLIKKYCTDLLGPLCT